MHKQLENKRDSFIFRFTEYILRGRREAVLVALIATLAPFLAWLGTVVMCFITLRKGAKEGFLILLWLALPSVIIGLSYKSGFFIIQSVLFNGLFIWCLALTLRSTAAWSTVVELVVLLGVVAVVVINLYLGDSQQYWLAFFQQYMTLFDNLLSSPADSQAIMPLIVILTKYMTGIKVSSMLLSGLISLGFARWLQSVRFNPGGLSQELRTVRLSWVSIGFLIIVLIGAYAQISYAYDLLLVLVLPCFLVGVSLAHFFADLTKHTKLLLFTFYGVLIVLFLQSVSGLISLLMLIAVADTAVNMRKRFL
ncbi:MAG: hypothetical protein V3V61_07480 [Gammaproteobacteria bacterium]